jgi:hypothetical protein
VISEAVLIMVLLAASDDVTGSPLETVGNCVGWRQMFRRISLPMGIPVTFSGRKMTVVMPTRPSIAMLYENSQTLFFGNYG